MKTKSTIPKGWTVRPFGEIFEFLPTLTLSRADLDSEKSDVDILNIHYGDIHTTYKYPQLDFDKEKMVPGVLKKDLDESKLTFLKDGDLVIADASEDYEGVGACIELQNIRERKVTAGLHTFAAREKSNELVNGFKGYLLKHPWVRNELKKLATGSKVFGIAKTNISNLQLVIPSKLEQQKIAVILSKWDEVIELQAQLVKKKEEYKKGLINQLLTQEIRFSEFNEDWNSAKVSDVFEFLSSNSFSRNQLEYKNGEKHVYNIHYGDIHATYEGPLLDLSVESRVPVIANGVPLPNRISYLRDGDLVIADASEDYKGVGEVVELKGVGIKKIVAGLHTFALRDKANLTTLGFRSYLFKHPDVSVAVKVIATGSKVFGISKTNFANIEVFLPDYHEQQKIASVFSAIDDEIRALKLELKALELQKKGLMQELLTGKIRVKK